MQWSFEKYGLEICNKTLYGSQLAMILQIISQSEKDVRALENWFQILEKV